MKIGNTIAATLLVVAVGFAGAQNTTNVKRVKPSTGMSVADWQAMYTQAAKLFTKKDAAGIFKYSTPDFSIVMEGHPQNKAQATTGLKTFFAMMKTVHCTMTVTKATGNGTSATVVDQITQAATTMPNPTTHKSSKFANKATETATWVKVKGTWMMKKLVITNQNMTMDGKPFNPGM